MELKECVVIVLHRHGVIKMNKACLCMIDLVEQYLTDFEDRLLSGLYQDVARRNGIERPELYTLLRALAMRMGRKDSAWYTAAFPEGYSTPVFLRVIAQEAKGLCSA